MGLFRRSARPEQDVTGDLEYEVATTDEDAPEVEEDVEDGTSGDGDGVAAPATSDRTAGAPATGDGGPWDVDEQPERGQRLDLGAVWLPPIDGMELRMELDDSRTVVTGAAITVDGSTLQLQAFAAPRTAGIWDEVRAEIAESVTKQGGSADDLPGPFGRELLARLPVRTSDGRTSHRPARFVGADGPRWFLRGVLTGRAAIDPESARQLEGVFADVVVLRGGEARAPRELLPLTLPGAAPIPPAQETRALPDPFARGPEITEVH